MGNTCARRTELVDPLAVKGVVVGEAQHQQVSRWMLLIISARKLIREGGKELCHREEKMTNKKFSKTFQMIIAASPTLHLAADACLLLFSLFQNFFLFKFSLFSFLSFESNYQNPQFLLLLIVLHHKKSEWQYLRNEKTKFSKDGCTKISKSCQISVLT